MKRFAWIVCAFSLLALNACGDEDAPACDDELYDCTPLDDGKQPPGDGQNPPDDSTLPNPPQWEEGWVPSKEDLAAIGVVFPDDLDPKPPWSLSAFSGDGFDTECNIRAEFDHRAYTLFICDFGYSFFGETRGRDYINEYSRPSDFDKRDYYCSIITRGKNSAPVMHGYETPERTRFHGPPTDSFDWACIETPYGAAWLPLDDATDAKINVARKTRIPETEGYIPMTTCHPTVQWVSLIGDKYENNASSNIIYAYTVGTELDEFKPVTTCLPWGASNQSSD